MTVGGWIILIMSVGSVTGLFVLCIVKVLKTPGETERMHGVEFETPDESKIRKH